MDTSEIILKILEIIATLSVGAAGIYFANSYRRQIRLKTSEKRIDAYIKLWEITKLATPMRVYSWHEGNDKEELSLGDRKQLYRAMTNWYYENGQGLYLGDLTRNIYLAAKHNLLCPDRELIPKWLKRSVEGLPRGEERLKKRSELSIRQLSLLRHQMRRDLEVYGTTFFTGLGVEDDEQEKRTEDKLFLKYCSKKSKQKL